MQKFFVLSSSASGAPSTAKRKFATKEKAVGKATEILQNQRADSRYPSRQIQNIYVFEAVAVVQFPPKPVEVKDALPLTPEQIAAFENESASSESVCATIEGTITEDEE